MSVSFEKRVPPGEKEGGGPHAEVLYVNIQVSPSETVSRVATEDDKFKHPEAYAEFTKGKAEPKPEVKAEPPADFMPGFAEEAPIVETKKSHHKK